MAEKTVFVPADAQNCRRCTVLMPIPGIVMVGERDKTLCSDCEASENRRLKVARVSGEQVDIARVQTWAQWRREGKSYDEITALDTLEPSYPTIKKYLEHFGFDGDGMPLNGGGPTQPRPAKLPQGWGPVESNVPSPLSRTGTYQAFIATICAIATSKWQRIAAPTDYRARKLSTELGKQRPDLHRRVKQIEGTTYLYFRLKKDGDG